MHVRGMARLAAHKQPGDDLVVVQPPVIVVVEGTALPLQEACNVMRAFNKQPRDDLVVVQPQVVVVVKGPPTASMSDGACAGAGGDLVVVQPPVVVVVKGPTLPPTASMCRSAGAGG